MEKTGSPPTCPTCYGTEFRASRMRPEDRKYLLLLKLPVRCTFCRTRTYASRAFVKQLHGRGPAGEPFPAQ